MLVWEVLQNLISTKNELSGMLPAWKVLMIATVLSIEIVLVARYRYSYTSVA